MRALLAAAAVGAAGLLIGVLVRQRRRRERKTLPPAQIISLSRRPAKRASVLERAAAAGLEQVEIFDAVDGRELAAEGLSARGVRTYSGWKLEGSTDRFFSRALKWGEIGCALSHHGVWELARASKEDAMLVLEDDVDFLPGFVELLRASLDEVDALVADGLVAPPDLLYLTRRAMRPEHDQLLPRKGEPRLIRTASGDEVMGPPRLVVPGFSYKTTAYVLYRRGAAKLAESGYLSKVGDCRPTAPRHAKEKPRVLAQAHADGRARPLAGHPGGRLPLRTLLQARGEGRRRAPRYRRSVRVGAATERACRPAAACARATWSQRHGELGAACRRRGRIIHCLQRSALRTATRVGWSALSVASRERSMIVTRRTDLGCVCSQLRPASW